MQGVRGAPVAHVFAPTGAAAESCHAQCDWRVVCRGLIFMVVQRNAPVYFQAKED